MRRMQFFRVAYNVLGMTFFRIPDYQKQKKKKCTSILNRWVKIAKTEVEMLNASSPPARLYIKSIPFRVFRVVGQQQHARLFVQRRLWVGFNEKTSDHHQHVAQPHLAVPILTQRVHTDLPLGLRDVWVEDLGAEEALRGCLRVLAIEQELDVKLSALEGGVDRPGDACLHLTHVVPGQHFDTVQRTLQQVCYITHHSLRDRRGDRRHVVFLVCFCPGDVVLG